MLNSLKFVEMVQESPFFGEHALNVWFAGLLWSLIGILFIKIYNYPRGVKFSLKYWINDNTRDVLLGLIASLLILRLGDYALGFLHEKFGFNVPETEDFVIVMIVISATIQVYLHKKRKPLNKKLQKEMDNKNQHNKK